MAGFRVQKGHIFGHFPSQPPLIQSIGYQDRTQQVLPHCHRRHHMHTHTCNTLTPTTPCRYLQSVGMSTTKILAKIETRQALLNFQGILTEADGIIISRGNLGLDCEPEKMALVQKTVIQVRLGGGRRVALQKGLLRNHKPMRDQDRKSTRLNSSHPRSSRMPSSA